MSKTDKVIKYIRYADDFILGVKGDKAVSYTHLDVYKRQDFMSEPDYGYIDIESCFEPIFEPPLETLEEWRSWEDEPEPTLENTSVYVTEPDGIQYFYCGNTRIRVSEHFSQAGKPMDKLIENVIQYAARNAG